MDKAINKNKDKHKSPRGQLDDDEDEDRFQNFKDDVLQKDDDDNEKSPCSGEDSSHKENQYENPVDRRRNNVNTSDAWMKSILSESFRHKKDDNDLIKLARAMVQQTNGSQTRKRSLARLARLTLQELRATNTTTSATTGKEEQAMSPILSTGNSAAAATKRSGQPLDEDDDSPKRSTNDNVLAHSTNHRKRQRLPASDDYTATIQTRNTTTTREKEKPIHPALATTTGRRSQNDNTTIAMSPMVMAQQQSPSSRDSSCWATQPPTPLICQAQTFHHYLHPSSSSVNNNKLQSSSCPKRCTPLKSPIPSHFPGDMEEMKDTVVPDFHRLVNYFPASWSSDPLPNGMRLCVMCGSPCPSTKNGGGAYFIPTQNKGVCTQCDVQVWVVLDGSGLQIKWCKGCKNFRHWAAFGIKGGGTKCHRCRERSRQYTLQKKEEKLAAKTKNNNNNNVDTFNHQIKKEKRANKATIEI